MNSWKHNYYCLEILDTNLRVISLFLAMNLSLDFFCFQSISKRIIAQNLRQNYISKIISYALNNGINAKERSFRQLCRQMFSGKKTEKIV